MSMFDTFENFEQHFKPGDTFTLQGVKLGAMMNTVHGPTQQVLFKIDDKVYSAFGAGFVAQAQRAEAKDFPAQVEFVTQPPKRQGNSPTKLLWPIGAAKPWDNDNEPAASF